MEFATEMIAQVARNLLRYAQIFVPLKKAQNERTEKLRTVRDGVRHLFILEA